MNDSIYEEYMRNVLGYQQMNNTYNVNYDGFEIPNMNAMSNIQMRELEDCYPDIYRIIYPMVQKACEQNVRPLTRELIDTMTDEIFFAIEDKEMLESRDKNNSVAKTTEDRQIVRNTGLNDLIRILILRELLGRPGFPGGRPPRPPMRPLRPPMRPPIGRPPRPESGMRTPLFNDDLYES